MLQGELQPRMIARLFRCQSILLIGMEETGDEVSGIGRDVPEAIPERPATSADVLQSVEVGGAQERRLSAE